MTNILCIYHANCADGFGAAWVVRRALGLVEFFEGHYRQDPPDVKGKHVILVDFSYKRDVLLQMGKDALSVLVLDHHKSAAEDLCGLPPVDVPNDWLAHLDEITDRFAVVDPNLPRAVFDMERSGAMIAWDYFLPYDEAPLLLQHIQDRDLWKFEMEGSRRIAAALFSRPFSFEVWDTFMSEEAVARLMWEGGALVRDTTQKINDFIEHAAYRTMLHGYDVPILNAPYFFASEAGHIMAEGEPFSVTYYDTPKGRKFSLRSNDEGADVSEIATKFGGGGHRNAAGFEVSHTEQEFFLLEVLEKSDD